MTLRKQIATRLRQAMAESSTATTQSQLERRSGVAQATIGRILRAETDARIDTLWAIAEALGKPAAYFMDARFTNLAQAPEQSATRKAPVISWVQAGQWAEASDPYPPGDGEEWEDVPLHTGEHAFWLRVIGDSMTAPVGVSIPENSLILVDPSVQPDNGRLVVAKLSDTEEVTFKKLVTDSGRKWLKPLNPAYPMIEIDTNCHIVGVVVEAKQRL